MAKPDRETQDRIDKLQQEYQAARAASKSAPTAEQRESYRRAAAAASKAASELMAPYLPKASGRASRAGERQHREQAARTRDSMIRSARRRG